MDAQLIEINCLFNAILRRREKPCRNSLNEARELTEWMIDRLFPLTELKKKPRAPICVPYQPSLIKTRG